MQKMYFLSRGGCGGASLPLQWLTTSRLAFSSSAVATLRCLLSLREHFDRSAKLPPIGGIIFSMTMLVVLRRGRSVPGEFA